MEKSSLSMVTRGQVDEDQIFFLFVNYHPLNMRKQTQNSPQISHTDLHSLYVVQKSKLSLNYLTLCALQSPDPLSLYTNSAALIFLYRINQPADNYCCYGTHHLPSAATHSVTPFPSTPFIFSTV